MNLRKAAMLALGLCLSLNLLAQGFALGHRSQTFTDPARANRQVKAEIYYPATTAGDNVPLASGKFPVLVFGHGFVMGVSAYANLWNALVPEGYVFVLSDTETGFSPDHEEFGKDLAFLADQMQVESATPASAFYLGLTDSTAVMGHSMGGGASFLAVQYSSHIRALANLAPAETNPSAIAAAANISVPALVIAGLNDCVTPPPQHQVPMYDSLASACKTYLGIKGGGHCYMAEYNFNCAFGEMTCSPQPSITRAQQHQVINSYLLPWLDFFLKGKCQAGNDFQALAANDPDNSILQNCQLGCANVADAELANDLPRIAQSESGIRLMAQAWRGRYCQIEILNPAGELVWQKELILPEEAILLEGQGFSPGVYLIRVTADAHSFSQKILLHP